MFDSNALVVRQDSANRHSFNVRMVLFDVDQEVVQIFSFVLHRRLRCCCFRRGSAGRARSVLRFLVDSRTLDRAAVEGKPHRLCYEVDSIVTYGLIHVGIEFVFRAGWRQCCKGDDFVSLLDAVDEVVAGVFAPAKQTDDFHRRD